MNDQIIFALVLNIGELHEELISVHTTRASANQALVHEYTRMVTSKEHKAEHLLLVRRMPVQS